MKSVREKSLNARELTRANDLSGARQVAYEQRNGKDGRVRGVSQFRKHQPEAATNRFYRQSRSFRKYRGGSPAGYMAWEINCRLPKRPDHLPSSIGPPSMPLGPPE